MLSTQLTSTALLNAFYQRTNGLTKDEACLSTTYEKCMPRAAATSEGATTIAAMTKQLTTTTATNAASSITQTANLAPTIISPTSACATTDATSEATQQKKQPATTIVSTTTTSVSSDTSGRSAALERAYVHDVYENCEEPTGPVRPRVAQFLGNLEPGSVVCDVGCGSGRYLTQCNPAICTIGVDRCYRLGKVAHERGGEVTLCDNLELPFRNDSFDAVLSLAVVHHFATTERRVRALRELARILRIGGRVVITVWALEQRHRRFESQDVLIPWQPPKNRNFSYSDEDDEDDFLPPYHAYTEDSTNSSRSAGDGDSSSLSSSSPGESCYSFVRRAIQKLAGGRRHAWFLDSWTSKDTKNNSSLDYEDAKDLPIELRRLEDFDDFSDPPLSASLKSRSLGSILQTPPRQIVRSRSSVPSLGGPLVPSETKASATAALLLAAPEGQLQQNGRSSPTATVSAGSTLSRRPKLIKQKQSLCDEDDSLVQSSEQSHSTEFQMISSYNGSNGGVSSSLYARTGCYASTLNQHASATSTPPTEISDTPAPATMPSFLRKQSSLNEDLMAGNRLREREGVRKRIQKQTSLNEAFLCRSAMFSKRLQIIRDGFTTKIKSSTGSLERVTKTGINKLMQNIKPNPTPPSNPIPQQPINKQSTTPTTQTHPHPHAHPHQHHHHHHLGSNAGGLFSAHLLLSSTSSTGPVSYCSTVDCSAANLCHCSAYQQDCAVCAESEQGNERRHSRESGSDSSKDSSLQSDTSIESEDSFASVIFIPKPEQAQQQLNYQQQHQNSNSSSSNSGSSNGAARAAAGPAAAGAPTITTTTTITTLGARLPHTHTHTHSVPTSPLIMPCPPTPAHSPAANQGTVTSPPQTMSAVTAAMAILTPAAKPERFNFDAAHIKQQQEQQMEQTTIPKITRQAIREMPAIPKFRKQQSLQLHRQNFPIVRRASGSGSSSSISTKLLSLELFNPATDDLDSDSSEPSSPDSVDSVISAPRSTQLLSSMSTGTGKSSDDSDSALGQQICHTQDEYLKGELPINNGTPNENDIILNADSAPLLPDKRDAAGQAQANQQPHDCAEFAEQLTAQLQRELDDKYNRVECRSLDGIGDIGEFLSGGTKKRCNGDLSALRDELRERRLMLANLSTQPSLQHSPNSSSTSSLSSQTRSFTIPEEQEGEEEEEDEENERSYTLGIYEHCKISKFKYKRNRHYNLNPETAYLLQEDGDSDVRDDEYHIPEEDEDAEAIEARGGDQLGEGMHEYGQRRRNFSATKSVASSASSSTDTAPSPSQQLPQHPKTLQQRTSTESLEHSNSSTTSLDSPSQGGGATTHHRFYHVFREGELDALINHHVASLHIVSSYYERASWCVVAEKVQVWTI